MFFEDWSIDYDRWGDTGAQTFAAVEAAVSPLYGGAGDDYLVGGSGTDWLFGQGGDDQLIGGAGGDLIYGNQGADTVWGGIDGDTIYGGQAADTLYAELGADLAYGNKGGDYLAGGGGNDTLYGGQGDDSVLGEAGADEIWGNRGDDTLRGGDGADTFGFGGSFGDDRIADFEMSADKLNLSGAVTVTADGGSAVLTLGGQTVTLTGIAAANVTTSLFSDPAAVTLTLDLEDESDGGY